MREPSSKHQARVGTLPTMPCPLDKQLDLSMGHRVHPTWCSRDSKQVWKVSKAMFSWDFACKCFSYSFHSPSLFTIQKHSILGGNCSIQQLFTPDGMWTDGSQNKAHQRTFPVFFFDNNSRSLTGLRLNCMSDCVACIQRMLFYRSGLIWDTWIGIDVLRRLPIMHEQRGKANGW